MSRKKDAKIAPSSPRATLCRASKKWQKTQEQMVQDIARHALEGGREIAGQNANAEQAIDAYLAALRNDLIALAKA